MKVTQTKMYLRQAAVKSIQRNLHLYQAGVQYGERVSNVPNNELFEDSLSVLIEAAMEVALEYNISLSALATSVIKEAAQVLEERDMSCWS